MNEKSTGKIVSFTLDPNNPPNLTPEQQERLDSMLDEDIDLSDIPSQAGKSGWMRPGRLTPEFIEERRLMAEQYTLKLEADVLQFFKESGDISPRRINAVLREYVKSHRKSA